MVYIILCILINSGIILCFRVFGRYNIDSFQAIVANYFVASTLGFSLTTTPFSVSYILSQPWLSMVFILGLLFVSLFYLIAVTTNVFGVSVSSVSNKMSVVIPVLAAVYLYGDTLNIVKIIGIIIALIAVVMVSYKKDNSTINISNKALYSLPVILFIGCGSIDAVITYLQKHYTTAINTNEYILSSAFLFAAFNGIIVFTFLVITKKIDIHYKSIGIGLLLGIPNFFSMYLVMKSLESNIMTASVFFPVNNMAIVAVCTIISFVVFKEQLSKLNIAGVALSIIAIFIIAFL